ncbi:MAG: DUF58 domain-containing protein [Lachnospiraceae bacterium]|jgi:uncharacterized protein (DUF58 family)|nr:DUF58 domain-containing protein [Lachnospiraceae bacterium]
MKKRKFAVHAWGILRYALLLALVVFLWWYFRTYELLLIMIILFLLPVLSLLALYARQNDFSAQVSLPGLGIGKGRAVPMNVRIKNVGRFLGFAADVTYVVRNVFTEYEETKKERIWAGPGVNVVAKKELTSHHVGRVEVAVTAVTLWDWLGICSLESEAKKSSYVIVGPDFTVMTEEDLALSVENFPDENETKKHGTDVNPDIEIREYIPGDDLKSIHWKLTAKVGRTMVRERLATGRDRINVLLALTEDPAENDELMASLHGLGRLLIDKGYPIRLCWMGYGGTIQGRYLAEEGELENAMDEILSISGKKDPAKARNAMEAEFPGEAYIVVKHGAYKGTYIR